MDEKESAVRTETTAPAKPKKRKKKNRKLRRILAGVVTAVLILTALLAFALRDRLSSDSLRETFGRSNTETSVSEPYTYEVGTGQVFAAAGNGFAVASSSSLEYLDRDGKPLFKQLVSYSRPAVAASAHGVLFCDLDTEHAVWLDSDGNKLELTPYAEVLSIGMNDDGYVTLTTAAAGYKGLVSVYDPGGKPIYQWWSGTGYVLSAAVSPDDKLLAVLCAENGGGRVHVFRMDSETELSETAFPDELPFDLAFLGNNALCAVSQEALTFLDTDGSVRERFTFGDYYLMDYEFADSFAAVYVSAYRSGGGGYLESFNASGELLAVHDQERDVVSFSSSGRQLLVLTGGGWTLYNQDLNSQRSREGLMTAKKALLRADGSILLLGSYAAERIR